MKVTTVMDLLGKVKMAIQSKSQHCNPSKVFDFLITAALSGWYKYVVSSIKISSNYNNFSSTK